MPAKREGSRKRQSRFGEFARNHRLLSHADPDFPTTRALQKRLVAEGRVAGEGPPRQAPAASSPDTALPGIELRTMADFRRALAIPGVQVVRLDTPAPTRRTVAVLQSNAVAFRVAGRGDAPSWLWFGRARDWRFAGNRATRLHPDDGEPVLVYELHRPSETPPGVGTPSRRPA